MTDQCTLCDLPTPDPPVCDDAVDGTFCCRGCLEVARSLDDPATDGPEGALDTGDDEADGAVEYLAVEGMHCATCEAFLEARATDAEGVLAADASYPTGAVRVTYDPDALGPDELPTVLDGTGYRAQTRDDESDGDDRATGRVLVGLFFGMMTMLWYVLFLYPAYLGLPARFHLVDLSGSAGAYLLWNLLAMTGVVLGYTGWPVLRGAYVSLRAGRPNMDLLVGMAATTAFAYSTVALLLGRVEVYFDVATVVVLATTVGDYYKERVRKRATGRLSDLTTERAEGARLRTDDGTEQVALAALSGGDEVVVEAGERVPVDGTVREGRAAVTEALVTGEAAPERRGPGEEVVAGGRVTDGELVVEVAPGAESTLDRLVDALWRERSARGGVQRLVDRVAAVFVPVVLVLAVGTAVGHVLLGTSAETAALVGLTVLVVSCPCALGLATPLAVAAGVRTALTDGVVVTSDAVFERAPRADVVAFDKTGTLTTGEMRLIEEPDRGALARAAALERAADHPVASAIVDAAGAVDLPTRDVVTHPGRGVSGTVDGDRVLVGSAALFDGEGWDVPAGLRERAERARSNGRVPALVGRDGQARDVVVAGDEPRDGYAAVLDALGDREVVVISGDGEAAVRPFRDHPAVDEVFAGVPPEGKSAVVDRLAERGTVAMVGDGSNDAPALAAAHVGVALESGTQLAADAADAVVTTDDLAAVPRVLEVTAATRSRVRQNLAWACCYNAVAVPLAVAGLLNPVLAAVAMAASSLLVVANGARSLGVGDGGTADRSTDTGARGDPAASAAD